MILLFSEHNPLDTVLANSRFGVEYGAVRAMTTNNQAGLGKSLLGGGTVAFAQGLIWFRGSSPEGIFTFQPLGLTDAFSRGELVVGMLVAACGVLLCRNAARKLTLVNYFAVSFFAAALLWCASRISRWAFFLDHQSEKSLAHILRISVTEIAFVVCVALLASWWADREYLYVQLRERMPFNRFLKYLGSHRADSR